LYDEALLATERGRALLTDLEGISDWIETASPRVLDSVSNVQHTQGIVLAVPLERRQPPARRRRQGALHDVTVILDDVADPGNMGAILRCARAAGVPSVRVTEGSADAYGPKVVRAAGGAHFWLPIEHGFRWGDGGGAATLPGPVVLAEAHAGIPFWSFDWSGPATLVVGGEAHGAGAGARRAAAAQVRIPMPGGGDSVNVALAAAVILFEAVRQRSTKASPA
jgi:TrmH family RNA methyltransferase